MVQIQRSQSRSTWSSCLLPGNVIPADAVLSNSGRDGEAELPFYRARQESSDTVRLPVCGRHELRNGGALAAPEKCQALVGLRQLSRLGVRGGSSIIGCLALRLSPFLGLLFGLQC